MPTFLDLKDDAGPLHDAKVLHCLHQDDVGGLRSRLGDVDEASLGNGHVGAADGLASDQGVADLGGRALAVGAELVGGAGR